MQQLRKLDFSGSFASSPTCFAKLRTGSGDEQPPGREARVRDTWEQKSQRRVELKLLAFSYVKTHKLTQTNAVLGARAK